MVKGFGWSLLQLTLRPVAQRFGFQPYSVYSRMQAAKPLPLNTWCGPYTRLGISYLTPCWTFSNVPTLLSPPYWLKLNYRCLAPKSPN